MRIERDPRGTGPLIGGLGPSGFRIDEVVYRAALLTAEEARDWSPPPVEALIASDLAFLIAAKPEFILLGSGATLVRPSRALADALDAQDIGLEPMDSRAAARAWNVLRTEGRDVAAALYPLTAGHRSG